MRIARTMAATVEVRGFGCAAVRCRFAARCFDRSIMQQTAGLPHERAYAIATLPSVRPVTGQARPEQASTNTRERWMFDAREHDEASVRPKRALLPATRRRHGENATMIAAPKLGRRAMPGVISLMPASCQSRDSRPPPRPPRPRSPPRSGRSRSSRIVSNSTPASVTIPAGLNRTTK
jgi:hypothetical protein